MNELPGGIALVVGINAYSGGIKPLRSATADAAAIAAVLREHHDYEVTLLLDEEASALALTSALTSEAVRASGIERPFLLYFAGHGVARGDGNDGPQGYLLPHDALPGEPDSWVSMITVRAALEAMSSRHLLVVLDCCFAGAFRWAATRDSEWDIEPLYASQYERFLKGTAWQALTSASHKEKALDVAPGRDSTRDDALDGRHSPFAAALLRGLSGDADSSRPGMEADGVITATELFQYTFDLLVPAEGQSHQTPGLWPLRNDNTGQFIFRNPSRPLNTREDPPLTDEANPWLGLRTYTRANRALFFGRKQVINDLSERVTQSSTAFLAVVGASGTGKSSVVRAGLIPRLTDPTLEGGPWRLVKMPRLSANPDEQLQHSIAEMDATPADQRSLLLIDQFEELYTQCADDELRLNFLRRLRALIDQPGSPFVIITLRTDFEPRPKNAEALRDIWPDARFLVPAFTLQEMREVIVGPANAMSLFFEPDELVEALLQEVNAMPGALPLLSFALAEMYRHAQKRRRASGSQDRALTRTDYDQAGGVVGALHGRANLLYDGERDEPHRAAIRLLFLRLVSAEAGLTRRRVHRSELIYTGDQRTRIDHVVQNFTDARLLVTDGDYIEPAHDTLVVAWDKLQDWLADSGSQQLIRAAWRGARTWQEQSQDKDAESYLWHDDPRLPQLAEQIDELNQVERDFLLASQRRKERNARKRRVIFGAVAVALTAAAVISIIQADKATREARRAEQQTVVAQRETQRANEQYEQARLANGKTLVEQARQALTDMRFFDAAQTAAYALGFKGYGGTETGVALVPFFKTYDAEYGELVQLLTRANLTPFRPVAWRPLSAARLAQEKSVLVGLSADRSAELWDLDRGVLREFELPASQAGVDVTDLALSADGRRLALLFSDTRSVWLWRLDDPNGLGEPQYLDVPLESGLFALRFSDDAARLAVAGAAGVAVWALDDATSLAAAAPGIVRTSSFTPRSLTFRPRSRSLLIGGEKRTADDSNGPLLLVDLSGRCGQPGRQVSERDACAQFVGPRSDRLVVEQAGRYRGRLDFARAVAFSANGEDIAIGSHNRVFVGKVGDTYASYDDVTVLQSTSEPVAGLAFTPDGRALAVASAGLIDIVDVQSGQLIARVQPDIVDYATTESLVFSADTTLLLHSGRDHMRLYDTSFLGTPTNTRQDWPNGVLPEAAHADPDTEQSILREFFARTSAHFDSLRLSPGSLINRATWDGDTPLGTLVSGDRLSRLDLGDSQFAPVAAQAPPGRLVAIGLHMHRFLYASAMVNVYERDTAELAFRFEVEPNTIDDVGFDAVSNSLLAVAKFYDGLDYTLYRWSLERPNLAVYYALGNADCTPPVNAPAGSVLSSKSVLTCSP